MRRIVLLVLALLPLLVVTAWLGYRAGHRRESPAGVRATLARRLGPRLPTAASCGAVQRSPLDRYDQKTIYAWVDGGAEAYLKRGFIASAVATYELESAAGRVEIEGAAVRFASRQGAAEHEAAERPQDARPAPGVPGAAEDGTSLVVRRGRDVLQLVSFTPEVEARDLLAQVARAWVQEEGR